MHRAILPAIALAALHSACGGPTAFCDVVDGVRLTVAEVPPDRYPEVAAQHVDEVRQAAQELSGQEGSLAVRIADDLEAASQAGAGSPEFTERYTAFVADSNEFSHRYCVEQGGG